jgi:hypothetical protein
MCGYPYNGTTNFCNRTAPLSYFECQIGLTYLIGFIDVAMSSYPYKGTTGFCNHTAPLSYFECQIGPMCLISFSDVAMCSYPYKGTTGFCNRTAPLSVKWTKVSAGAPQHSCALKLVLEARHRCPERLSRPLFEGPWGSRTDRDADQWTPASLRCRSICLSVCLSVCASEPSVTSLHPMVQLAGCHLQAPRCNLHSCCSGPRLSLLCRGLHLLWKFCFRESY